MVISTVLAIGIPQHGAIDGRRSSCRMLLLWNGLELETPGAPLVRRLERNTSMKLNRDFGDDRMRDRDGNVMPTNLEGMIAGIEIASARDIIRMQDIIKAVGTRSFGALLAAASLIAVSPLSAIPGMPTTIAAFVFIISGQLLLNRDCCWLPGWATRKTIAREKALKAVRFMKPFARFVDRFLRPRLLHLTEGAGVYAIALCCILIAATMPPLELIPFAASTAGVVLSALGLSLISRDGLLALIALSLTAATLGLALYKLL